MGRWSPHGPGNLVLLDHVEHEVVEPRGRPRNQADQEGAAPTEVLHQYQRHRRGQYQQEEAALQIDPSWIFEVSHFRYPAIARCPIGTRRDRRFEPLQQAAGRLNTRFLPRQWPRNASGSVEIEPVSRRLRTSRDVRHTLRSARFARAPCDFHRSPERGRSR